MTKQTVKGTRIKKITLEFMEDAPTETVSYEVGVKGVEAILEQPDHIIIRFTDKSILAYRANTIFSFMLLFEEFEQEVDVPDDTSADNVVSLDKVRKAKKQKPVAEPA